MCGGGKPLLWVEETVLSEVLDGLRVPPMEMDLRAWKFPENFRSCLIPTEPHSASEPPHEHRSGGSVTSLSQLTVLRNLYVHGTQVGAPTQDQLATFKQQHPSCCIAHLLALLGH